MRICLLNTIESFQEVYLIFCARWTCMVSKKSKKKSKVRKFVKARRYFRLTSMVYQRRDFMAKIVAYFRGVSIARIDGWYYSFMSAARWWYDLTQAQIFLCGFVANVCVRHTCWHARGIVRCLIFTTAVNVTAVVRFRGRRPWRRSRKSIDQLQYGSTIACFGRCRRYVSGMNSWRRYAKQVTDMRFIRIGGGEFVDEINGMFAVASVSIWKYSLNTISMPTYSRRVSTRDSWNEGESTGSSGYFVDGIKNSFDSGLPLLPTQEHRQEGQGVFFFGQILRPPTRNLMGVPLRRRQMGVTVGKSTVVSQVQERRSKWVDRTQARIRGENLWSK